VTSLLDNTVLVQDFKHCNILQVLQTTSPVYIVQTNYNNKIVDTTGDLSDAVEIAENLDRSAGAGTADSADRA
jgi:hypothetical protein